MYYSLAKYCIHTTAARLIHIMLLHTHTKYMQYYITAWLSTAYNKLKDYYNTKLRV